jgi:hypothetical protein
MNLKLIEKRLRFCVSRNAGGSATLMFFNGPRDAGHSERLTSQEVAALRAALDEEGFSAHLRDDDPVNQLRLGFERSAE